MNSILYGESPRDLKDVWFELPLVETYQDYRKSQLLVCKKGACLEKADTHRIKPKLVAHPDGKNECCVPAWDALDKKVWTTARL